MKTLAKIIYQLFYFLDEKLGCVEYYDYETAPYCGHHYNGHTGEFTKSDFHEGDGGCCLNTKSPFFKIGYYSGGGWYWTAPTVKTESTWNILGDISKGRTTYGVKALKNQLKSVREARKHGVKISLKYSLA